MLPRRSQRALPSRHDDGRNPARNEFEELASDMRVMLDRIETCWNGITTVSAQAGCLATLSADIARTPCFDHVDDKATSALEELRSSIGYMFANGRPS